MDDRIIIGEVVEETRMGNPVAVTFTDVACNVVNYRRAMVFPKLQGRNRENAEVVIFDFCLN